MERESRETERACFGSVLGPLWLPHQYLVKQKCPLAGQACCVVNHSWDVPRRTETPEKAVRWDACSQCSTCKVFPGRQPLVVSVSLVFLTIWAFSSSHGHWHFINLLTYPCHITLTGPKCSKHSTIFGSLPASCVTDSLYIMYNCNSTCQEIRIRKQ